MSLLSNKAVLLFLVSALFLLAPFYHHPNLGGLGLFVPNNITVWGVAICLIFLGCIRIIRGQELYMPYASAYMLAMPVLITLSTLISGINDPISWLFTLLFIWLGLFFVFSLLQFNVADNILETTLYLIVFSAAIHSFIGIVVHHFAGIESSLLPSSKVESLSGYFQQVNNQASYQTTAFAIAIYLVSLINPEQKSVIKKLILILFFFLGTYVIAHSGSRIGLLTLLVTTPLLLWTCREGLKQNVKTVVISALCIMCAIVAPKFSGEESKFDQLIDKTENYSKEARLGIYGLSLDLWKEKPIIGHGQGSFETVWQYNKLAYNSKHPEQFLTDQYITHPHNEFLFWLVEGGLLAVAGILLFLLAIALNLKQQKSVNKWVYTAFLLPILLHTQVELPFYSSAIHWFLFLFIVFMIIDGNKTRVEISNSFSMQKSLMIFSSLGAFVAIAFISHAFMTNYFIGKDDIQNALSLKGGPNPYFMEHLERVQMDGILMYQHNNQLTDAIPAYIVWAEKRIVHKPHIIMFDRLAMAYNDLRQYQKMCSTLQKTIALYPVKSQKNLQQIFQKRCQE